VWDIRFVINNTRKLNVCGCTPRFREELDHQRAQANYQRLHAKGKTEEARADLARLAIIKQQRAEAAKRREEEKKGIRGSAIFSVMISIKISVAVKRLFFVFFQKKKC
jgi:hypothetical protein